MAIDWGSKVLNREWLSQLDTMALRRFGAEGLAQEASTYVVEKLSENNWQRLASYSGNSKPETFLYSVASNALEEFSRNRFGRPRPPTWLQREGSLWVTIWKSLCLERQSPATLLDRFCAGEKRDPAFVNAVIRTIKARLPWCGYSDREIPGDQFSDFDGTGTMDWGSTPLEQELDQQQLNEAVNILAALFESLDCPSNIKAIENLQIDVNLINQLQRELDFSEEEILIVKMAYQEGLNLKRIAIALGMPHYQPGRILKSVFKRLMHSLGNTGYPVDDIQMILAETSR